MALKNAGVSNPAFGATEQLSGEAPAQGKVKMSRTERLGHAWRVRDDALWNPFEVIAFLVNIIFVFGFVLGQSHYLFVAELFFPVILLSVCVLVYQAIARRRSGESGALEVMRDRIGY
ncbi:hypothetical protein N4R57_00030 [Rhodobacteraceae bacterium D3-12]|nr:hypothetical protein N4R57_00030 [Rhodobacteraceae bacterium D3-12]